MVVKINYRVMVIFVSIISVILMKRCYGRYRTVPISTFSENTTGEPVLVPIIMYHQIKNSGLGKDVIAPYEFQNDIQFILDNHYTTITVSDLIAYVKGEGALPHRPIILSFDDGYLSNYKYAYPLLKEHDMCMVVSLIGKYTDDFSNICSDNLEYSHVTWDQLKEMVDSGHVEVQNHTYNLHATSKGRSGCTQKKGESLQDYESVLEKDIGSLQDKLYDVTGEAPLAFTYPYGRYSNHTDLVLKKLGFEATLSCDYGINVIASEPEVLFKLKE